LGTLNLDGNKLPYSPEWTTHVGIQYEWELGDLGSLSARGDYSWVDEQFSNAFNRDLSSGVGTGPADYIPSYSLVNARLQWINTGGSWRADLYVKNLADDAILSNSFLTNVNDRTFGTYLAPRTYGLKLVYSF